MEMEGLGYDVLNVPDHLSELIGPDVCARQCRRSDKTPLDRRERPQQRHPLLVAREVATLHLLLP
jgi:hypothetical protein